MKHQVEYSAMLGRSENYMSVYRHLRNIPQSVDAQKLFDLYMQECEDQHATIEKMQHLYFTLKNQKMLRKFGERLFRLGIIKQNTFYGTINSSFFSPDGLRPYSFINKCKKILAYWEANHE